MRFSQRIGKTPVAKVVQRESIDDDLIIGLWNCADEIFWSHLGQAQSRGEPLLRALWADYLKGPLDGMPLSASAAVKRLRDYYFAVEWFEVYDFLEFLADASGDVGLIFTAACNLVLEREQSAYRFVSGRVTEITAPTEIESIEHAVEASRGLAGVSQHLRQSLALMSDRKAPDYRNAAKEAICAVESLACHISGQERASLGQALKALEGAKVLHPSMKQAMTSMYGYTSDADGIRLAMTGVTDLTYSDAKYMLVICTAFVNYLLGRASETGKGLSQS